MTTIPRFKLYDEGNPEVREYIQPSLPFRHWDEVEVEEKEIMLQLLVKNGWCNHDSGAIFLSVQYLNHNYLRELPGKRLHNYVPTYNPYRPPIKDFKELAAALDDFKDIFVNWESGELVLVMLSVFTFQFINQDDLENAAIEEDPVKRSLQVENAHETFDKISSLLNYIFDQFCVNVLVTRNGFIPRQDEKIEKEIYQPTLMVLSDPKWKPVSDNLQSMFNDYYAQNYPEAITKAHSTVQRFLQILVGEEGKNSKGEYSNLFNKAKKEGIISSNRFIEGIISTIRNFIPDERANKSSAKAALEQANSADALLVMNVVMILLQHCLQNLGEFNGA